VPVDPFFDDWCALALPANLTGCPATAVPTGFDEDGLPLGMQVICSPASRAWRWRVARENAIRGYGLDRVDVAG
jgi:Asp-tRNA(Asn)/Glu-tRNA(Gln) amidotransferase A subunit family amidase